MADNKLFYGDNLDVLRRYLRDVIEREKAAIGVLITMEELTKPMLKEAAEAGFYKFESAYDTGTYPRIQILAVEKLMGGAQVAYPRLLVDTFKKAPPRRERQSNNSRSIPKNNCRVRGFCTYSGANLGIFIQ